MCDGGGQPTPHSRPTPVSNDGRMRWQSVSIRTRVITISGGYNARGEAARSIQYQVDGAIHTFLELDKNAAWFLKGVGGPKTQKGSLKAVEVLQLLRKTFDDHTAVAGGGDSAAVSPPRASQNPDDDIDPMDEMDALPAAAPPAITVRGKKRSPKVHGDRHALIQELVVPTRPRCAGVALDDTTVVSVYKPPHSEKRPNGNLYLRLDCVDWLLAYAADELFFQGVEPSSPIPTGPEVGNCPAVADLHLAWNFDAKSWEGRFVAGRMVGTTKRMTVNDIDTGTWEKLKDDSVVEGSLADATLIQRKQAIKHIMIKWGAATADNGAADSDAMDGSPRALPTPVRGTKRPLEDAEIAAAKICPAAADGASAVAVTVNVAAVADAETAM